MAPVEHGYTPAYTKQTLSGSSIHLATKIAIESDRKVV
jgi:hypothetical protein